MKPDEVTRFTDVHAALVTPLGLSGVFTVHAAHMTAAVDFSWDAFAVTLTPEMTPLDILRRAAVTLDAWGAECEFSTMDIDLRNTEKR
jgi:hypothetical protein